MGKDAKLTVLGMDVIAVERKDKNGQAVVGDVQEFKVPQAAFMAHMEEAVPGFKAFKKSEKAALEEVDKASLTFLKDQVIADKKAATIEVAGDLARRNYTVSADKQERNPQTGATSTVFGKCSLRVAEKISSKLRCGEGSFVDSISAAVEKALAKK